MSLYKSTLIFAEILSLILAAIWIIYTLRIPPFHEWWFASKPLIDLWYSGVLKIRRWLAKMLQSIDCWSTAVFDKIKPMQVDDLILNIATYSLLIYVAIGNLVEQIMKDN